MTIPLPVTHITVHKDNLKFCKDCRFFNAYGSKCKMFVKRDLVSGKVETYPAVVARSDDKMCGEDAKLYDSVFDGEDSY
jgi:hypothetical protein